MEQVVKILVFSLNVVNFRNKMCTLNFKAFISLREKMFTHNINIMTIQSFLEYLMHFIDYSKFSPVQCHTMSAIIITSWEEKAGAKGQVTTFDYKAIEVINSTPIEVIEKRKSISVYAFKYRLRISKLLGPSNIQVFLQHTILHSNVVFENIDFTSRFLNFSILIVL